MTRAFAAACALLAMIGCKPDADGDGYPIDVDCADDDPAIHPAAIERCDGADQDCDGEADEDATDAVPVFDDVDGDGFGDAATRSMACAPGAGQVVDAADCDDARADVHPGASEVCGGLDDDCDGLVDDDDDSRDPASGTATWRDDDGDGYGAAGTETRDCTPDVARASTGDDCDDADATSFPSATEVCDGADNDCDGWTDDADDSLDRSTGTTFYVDGDDDGYGGDAFLACDLPDGAAAAGGDCDEADPAVHPDAVEVCGGLDDDCDGLTDDADDSVDRSTGSVFYADTDGDGWGDAASATLACARPVGTSADGSDCDDARASVYPGATETCDGLDDDCDALTDDLDDSLDLGTASPWYGDTDGDGFGDASLLTLACASPTGSVADATDCDDADVAVHPDATEVCNTVDDDCDGLTDDLDDSVDLSTGTTWYADADEDAHGDPDDTLVACEIPAGYVDDDEDCDPADESVYPGARETCEDGIDQNCNGADSTCGGLYGEIDPEVDYDAVVYSSESSGVLGAAWDILDWDGDGQDDLVIGAFQSDYYATNGGRVWVHLGPLANAAVEEESGYEAAFYGTAGSAYVGQYIDAVGDLDGDGDDEVYIGASTSTSAKTQKGIVLGGSVSGDATIASSVAFSALCYAATGGGDPDDDGTNGWVCGDAGQKLSWYEGTDSTASWSISGPSSSGFSGDSVGATDLDGDGLADLWVSAPQMDVTYSDTGAAYLFSAPTATMTYTDADASVAGAVKGQRVGTTLQVADLDADGTPDLMAGSGVDDTAGTDGGAYWGWSGAFTGAKTLADADFAVYGDTGAAIGDRPPGVADLDGDGFDDLAFGSTVSAGRATSAGEVWLFYGPFSGTLDLTDAAADGAHLQGNNDYDYLGRKIILGSDLDGDGYPELVTSAHGLGWDGSATSGAWFLFNAD